ncbi:hypothetical protein [Parvibaculum sp.]|uniref:hypothetical protein n=1 Tax=Parvibaculum sp. TaxID=2024848 RepID=UPI0034A066C2
MSTKSFEIQPIADELNTRARGHLIGRLPWLRSELHNTQRSTPKLFTSLTTHPTWAFHHGGRPELQFNIGFEEVDDRQFLRHGVAFSFELSKSLRNLDVLVPKVRLFNDYMRLYPERYADMRMWHYREGPRSDDYPPCPISPDFVSPGPFVFLGKRQPLDSFEYEVILTDFDRLLEIYTYVESGGREASPATSNTIGFQFQAGCTDRAPATTASLAARELNITLKHNELQAALCKRLIAKYGEDNVADEHSNGAGGEIDVILRKSSNEYWYYEIKTAWSPRECIRQALGQILEYSYWPGANEPSRLIICGENPLDYEGRQYIEKLKSKFQLPILYEAIPL